MQYSDEKGLPDLVAVRMRRSVGVEQPLGVDGRIKLRCRQRCVAKQLLDGTQIAAPAEKMGCERMPQGVRRRRVRQPERASHPLDRDLDDARR